MLVPQLFRNTTPVAVQRKKVSAVVHFREELDVIVALVHIKTIFLFYFILFNSR